MKVYLPGDWETGFIEALEAKLAPGVELSRGPDLPEPADFEIVVSGRPLKETLAASPKLRAMIIPFAGVPAGTADLVSRFPGVAVHNLHHNALAAAEMALGLLLAVAKRIPPFDARLRAGDWRPRYDSFPSMTLHGRTAVVLGFGAIGRILCGLLRGIGMRTIAIRRTESKDDSGAADEVRPVSEMRSLLPSADVLAVCVPRTPFTDGMIGATEINLMPGGSVLVNVARGAVVSEQALYDALRSGKLFGAGLDVWYRYPKSEEESGATMPSDLPFHELPNVVMSPHRAGHVEDDMRLRAEHLSVLINEAAAGRPISNRVDLEAGY